MKILITNDDGVYAKGLWALVEAVKDVGEVIVVAPDREQSAVGTSVTLHQPLRAKRVNPLVTDIETYSVEGTPADSVILGLKMLAGDGVDLVMSGINEGVNLGNDVYISGTVGAALQGYFYEIPSIALSAAVYKARVRFEAASLMGKLLAEKVKQGVLHPRSLLNVNAPYLPLEKIEGIDLTSPGRRTYRDEIREGNDGKRDYYWIVRGEPVWDQREGTDIWAIQHGRISMAPLPGVLPDSSRMNILNDLCSALLRELHSSKE